MSQRPPRTSRQPRNAAQKARAAEQAREYRANRKAEEEGRVVVRLDGRQSTSVVDPDDYAHPTSDVRLCDTMCL